MISKWSNNNRNFMMISLLPKPGFDPLTIQFDDLCDCPAGTVRCFQLTVGTNMVAPPIAMISYDDFS